MCSIYSLFENVSMRRVLLYCMASWLSLGVVSSVTYKEEYFEQRFDHFNFATFGDRTFKQRYLYNDTFWSPGIGPIFFYAGNEGDIVHFWENTGFMLEIAPEFQALVLFAEHRYYGKSMPFGEYSLQVPNVGHLSIEQALADYVFLITSLKKTFNAENCSVVAFGGSFGGNLAAYMRFKFPNIIHGAIASSAPVYQLAGYSDAYGFYQRVTEVFRGISPYCEDSIRSAFIQLQVWAAEGQTGFAEISRIYRLCYRISSSNDFEHFLRWIRSPIGYAAQLDYPYPVTTMTYSFPAFPVNVMCNSLTSSATAVEGMYEAISLYYNSTQDVSCNDIYKQYVYCAEPTGCDQGPVSKAWDYQACTEVNLEGGTNGVTDMFPVLPFNSTMRDEYCLKTWNVRPRRNWLDVMYWGKDIFSSSNIVFSNGDLDPYSPGGVHENISSSILSIDIKGAAHHLDFRGSNPADPQSVIDARSFEVQRIKEWLSS